MYSMHLIMLTIATPFFRDPSLLFISFFTAVFFYLPPPSLLAEQYLITDLGNDSVVGQLQYVSTAYEDTLLDIARRYGIGHDELLQANPTVNRWLPGSGTKVLLPTRYLLPEAKREGIIINLAELRLYYFHSAGSSKAPAKLLSTYPVSVGRMDWKTPLGTTKIVRKDRDPAWYPPPSILREHELDGDPLPKVIPGGDPSNPLGRYALRLGIPNYLLHGTDERKVYGIGMRVTHGCIRMYPEDIEELFKRVSVGVPVRLVNQPIKVGVRGRKIYLEVHSIFEEDELLGENRLSNRKAQNDLFTEEDASEMLAEKLPIEAEVAFATVKRALRSKSGVPVLIGKLPQL